MSTCALALPVEEIVSYLKAKNPGRWTKVFARSTCRIPCHLRHHQVAKLILQGLAFEDSSGRVICDASIGRREAISEIATMIPQGKPLQGGLCDGRVG